MYGTFNRVLLDFLQTVRLIGTGHFGANGIKNSNTLFIFTIVLASKKELLPMGEHEYDPGVELR